MFVKEITVNVKRLIALKKFENVTYECSTTISLTEQDNPHEAYDQALKFCKTKILAEMDRLDGKQLETSVEEDYIPSAGFTNQGKE